MGGHTGNFYQAEGAAPLPEDASTPVTLSRSATPGYFDAMGINLLAGRTFSRADAAESAPPVVIVNQAFAEHHWPGENPIGRRIGYTGDDPTWVEVIGLTQDVKHYGLDEDMRPGLYFLNDRNPSGAMTIVARTAIDPLSIADEARALIRARDADLPIYRVSTMRQRLDESLWSRAAASWSFAIFAGVAMTLAISGIYGVVSYAVGQRTHEIGIRMALGARWSQVLSDVMRHGLLLLAAGVTLGLVATVLAARALSSLLFGVSATDPLVYTLVTLSLIAVAVLANLVPARRAASIDPMQALRDE
jgi:predicted permease